MITLHLDDTVIKSLTGNELNILKFVYGHPEEILSMSVHELARQVSYSAATVLRFCKKLGFSGFAELKYALRQELEEEELRAQPAKRYSLDTQLLIDNLSTNLEGTAKLIQEEQLYQTFGSLESGCPIYLWAPGGITSILADYFEKLLFSIGRQKVYKIDSLRMAEHVLRHIRTKALLILISASVDLSATARLARLAQIDNIPILSITPYANNTIASLATINFRFFTDPREDRGAEHTSQLPIFYVIHLIIRTYLHYKQTTAPSPDKIANAAGPMILEPELPTSAPIIPIFEKAHQLSLTDTEKELLRYLEGNLPASAFISLKDLGAKLYTSNATIVRFCQKLGLKGYNEFKYQLRSELERLKRPVFSSDSLIARSIAMIKDNLADVDIELLGSIANALTEDRPIYIYGSELSSLAADYLHTVLAILDYPSISIQWPSLLNNLTYTISSDALLFVITAHGDARRYLSVFQRTSQQKVTTVLLTCGSDSPLLPYSTYGLCTNDRNERYQQADINSRLGILTVIQLLIELIAQKRMT